LKLVQSAGIGIFMPLYYAVYTFSSRAQSYWCPLSRRIPLHYAKALLPAVLVGYIVPTLLMFFPWDSPALVQIFEAIWQQSPMLVMPLTMIFGAMYKARSPIQSTTITPQADEEPADLKYLKRVYIVTGVLGVLHHFYVVIKIAISTDPSFTLSSVFIGDYMPEPKELGDGLHSMFLADFWGLFVA
jgi:hypothetical protein